MKYISLHVSIFLAILSRSEIFASDINVTTLPVISHAVNTTTMWNSECYIFHRSRLKISGAHRNLVPKFQELLYKPTSDLQFATQNYTQTNKKCEEMQYKFFFPIAFRNFENRYTVILHIEKKIYFEPCR
jgi:hypothetical protein